jgi:surface polysaccharide O-acyltransferase-like enzyme
VAYIQFRTIYYPWPFFAVNAAFFMGLFFFISGYLLPAAYDRKGARQFLIDRFKRLGIPLLFFTFFIFPRVLYALSEPLVSFPDFVIQGYINPPENRLEIEVAHLWFLMHLLLYAVAYTLWRQLYREHHPASLAACSHRQILAYLLSLAVVTFIVRIDYPIDQWANVFGFLSAEIAHSPQYASLFILGTVACRRHWLSHMPTPQGLMGIGLSAVVLRYGYSLSQERFLLPNILAGGGLDLRSLVWSGWEATICVGLCIGLLILFRERANIQSRLTRSLSDNAYAVYLIHLLPILFLQNAIAPLSISPLIPKFCPN